MQLPSVASLFMLTIALSQSQAELVTVRNTSSVDPSGKRILEFTTTLDVPAGKVWVVTNPEEYKTWGAPSVFIDLRPGGVFEVGYAPGAHPGDDANVKHEITAFVPMRMIAFRNLYAPVGAAAEAYRKIQIVILLTDRADGATELSLTNVGFEKGSDFDGLYAFLAQHNPKYLEQLATYLGRQH